MKTKTIIIRVILILLIISITSCANNDSNIKIALMLNSLKIARFHKDSVLFFQEAQKLGCQGIVANADNNEQLQIEQARQLIDEGVKTLVIGAVNSNTAAIMVRMAQEEGVNTIVYDGIINNCAVDYCISFDNKKIGELMAQYAVSKAPEGEYIIFSGDKSNLNSIEIHQGMLDVLNPSLTTGKIKIIFDTYVEFWNRTEAYAIMKRFLKLSCGKIPAAILCANDDIGLGAIDAIKEYYHGKEVKLPIVTGQDASLEGCRSILKGEQSMTVYKPIKQLAGKSAEVAYKLIKHQKIEGVNATTFSGTDEIPTIRLDLISVDKLNMETTVVADGFQTKKDIVQ
jgi:D-xylose transport system substrate-binding protein